METENVEIIENKVNKDNEGSNVTLSMKLELGKLSIGSLQDPSFRTAATESYVFLARIPRFAVTLVVILLLQIFSINAVWPSFISEQTMSVFHTNKMVKIHKTLPTDSIAPGSDSTNFFIFQQITISTSKQQCKCLTHTHTQVVCKLKTLSSFCDEETKLARKRNLLLRNPACQVESPKVSQ